MTTLLLLRRFLADYTRNRVNLLFLALVPIVFVVVAAGALADAARLLGAAEDGAGVPTATAGWAAGFLAGTAMYFQLAATRETDRRMVLSGMSRIRLVAARLLVGATLALVAAAASLVALLARTGIEDPARVVSGTVMFAVIYVAIGATVGAVVPNPTNGTVTLMFVWIIDVFLGSTLTSSDFWVTRLLPTHFVSLWTVGTVPSHSWPDALGASVAWVALALLVAFGVVVRVGHTGSAQDRRRDRRPAVVRLRTGLRMAWREWRRTPTLWVLTALVPLVFVVLADLSTPSGHTPVELLRRGEPVVDMVDPAHMHAALMAPIAVAALAAIGGIFVSLDARAADRRLVLAGTGTGTILATRLAIVLLMAGFATAVSLGTVALVFGAHQWVLYAGGVVLVAVTYGLIGILVGPLVGRVSGTFLAFLVPFLDLGMGQSPMVRSEPPDWAAFLPGYGGFRAALDGALTPDFDATASLLLAGAWVAVLLLLAVITFRRGLQAQPRHPTQPARSRYDTTVTEVGPVLPGTRPQPSSR